MGNAADTAVGSTDAASVKRVLRAFEERIGTDRFAVWFGGVGVQVAPADRRTDRRTAAPTVTIAAGSGFTHEWLRRTFRADFEAAASAVCGEGVEVRWEPVANPVAEDRPTASPPPPNHPIKEAPAAAGEGGPGRRRPSGERGFAPGRHSTAAAPASPSRRRGHMLEDFVVGPSNRMAVGAVEMAVSRPGEVSPLVIHGSSGLGKTHLLEGACERVRELHPGATAVCLSAEQFTTAFLQALHGGGLPGFRRSCRGADLLVIDDVQFFVGKKATLLEVLHTIDALQRLGRQVILACDRELDALPELGADLLTRCRGGMTARILPPDYDVRCGIVTALCAKRGIVVPDDVTHYIATSMTRHARELYGAVNRLQATSTMLGLPVGLGMAEEALADLVRSSGRSVRLADIERAVCKAFGIDGGCLQSARRSRTGSHPRMLAMYLARKHTQSALAEIGQYFGRRSHSTVIAAQKAVGEWVASGTPIVLADATWSVDEAIRRVEDVLRAG